MLTQRTLLDRASSALSLRSVTKIFQVYNILRDASDREVKSFRLNRHRSHRNRNGTQGPANTYRFRTVGKLIGTDSDHRIPARYLDAFPKVLMLIRRVYTVGVNTL